MQARIYRPTKSSMQSAKQSSSWVLEYESEPNARFTEKLLGRVASKNSMNTVMLSFPDQESAIRFANANGLEFELMPSKDSTLRPKKYLN